MIRRSLLFALAFFLTSLPADDVKPQPLTLRIDTPTPGHRIEVLRLDQTDEGLAALLRVIPPPADAIVPMVIDEAVTTVLIEEQPDTPTLYVLQRPWDWGDETPVKSEQAYLEQIGEATPVDFKPQKD